MASTHDDEQVPINRETLTDAGADFNGEHWMMAFELAEPVRATALVCAVDQETVDRSAAPRPTGVSFAFAETDYGPVAVMLVTLFDQPDNPLTLDVMINPSIPGGRDLLEGLIGDTLHLIFMDRSSGDGLGMRYLPVDPDTQNAIRQAAAMSAAFPERSREDWQRASTIIRDHLGR